MSIFTKGDGSGNWSKESIVAGLGSLVSAAALAAQMFGYDLHVDPKILGSVGSGIWFLMKLWERRRAAKAGQ